MRRNPKAKIEEKLTTNLMRPNRVSTPGSLTCQAKLTVQCQDSKLLVRAVYCAHLICIQLITSSKTDLAFTNRLAYLLDLLDLEV